MTIEKRSNHKPSNKINRSMLKNLSLIALLGIAVVGLPSELSAKNVKVAGTQKWCGCQVYHPSGGSAECNHRILFSIHRPHLEI